MVSRYLVQPELWDPPAIRVRSFRFSVPVRMRPQTGPKVAPETGLLKRYMLQPFESWLFQHQNKGTPPFTSCNVQVYHVRIPEKASKLELRKSTSTKRMRYKGPVVKALKWWQRLRSFYLVGPGKWVRSDAVVLVEWVKLGVVSALSGLISKLRGRDRRYLRRGLVQSRLAIKATLALARSASLPTG